MADFPEIGCRAFAQYPSSFELHAPVVVQHYVDGTEQRFRDTAPSLRIWTIRLQRLTEDDAVRVRDFFRSVSGAAAHFRFKDPWSGAWVENCWFRSDELHLDHIAENHLSGELQIYCEDK